jgi:hypothetical protein
LKKPRNLPPGIIDEDKKRRIEENIKVARDVMNSKLKKARAKKL